jgi:metal-responsive CopG/Arc/MetJ family transcriptional regulator
MKKMLKKKFERKLSIILTQDVFEEIEKMAIEQEKTISNLVREILFNFLRKDKNEKKDLQN